MEKLLEAMLNIIEIDSLTSIYLSEIVNVLGRFIFSYYVI